MRKRQNPSRILASGVLKSPMLRAELNKICKLGQAGDRPRAWFLTNIAEYVVAPYARRIRSDTTSGFREFASAFIKKNASKKWGRDRMRAEVETAWRAKMREVGSITFKEEDLMKAASRLLRKMPMLERC